MTNFDVSKAPSPVTTDSNEPPRLSTLINTSTRPTHSQLNRLIIDRIPLALPPHTTDANTYLRGLLHIAPIYITFESLWKSIVDDVPPANAFEYGLVSTYHSIAPDNRITSNVVYPPNSSSRIRSILSLLQVPGLARSSRLQADLRPIARGPEKRLEEQLRETSEIGELAEFIAHIRLSVGRKPHVLIAFAWVLYMALFSGGRILRHSLQSLLNGTTGSGLLFFEFDGDEDGEDIRRDFKMRFSEAEDILTPEEKDDVVLEAQEIFEYMIKIVFELDEICRNGQVDESISEQRMVTTLVQRAKNQVDAQEGLLATIEPVKDKLNHRRKRKLQILSLAFAVVAWCYIRWRRYPSPSSVAQAALGFTQVLE